MNQILPKTDKNGKHPPLRALTPAEQELVLANQGLAFKQAWNYAVILASQRIRHGYFIRLVLQYRDELVGAAMCGLCTAAQRWDPALGKFSTYAVWHIKGFIRDEAHRSAIRIGPAWKYPQPVTLFSEDHHSRSHDEEGERDTGFRDVFDHRDADKSLDYGDVPPELIVLMRLANLDERYIKIVIGRFIRGRSLEELGWEVRVSKERMRQLVIRALRKLKDNQAFVRALEARVDALKRIEYKSSELGDCGRPVA